MKRHIMLFVEKRKKKQNWYWKMVSTFSLDEHKEDKYWFYFSIDDADNTSITLNHENEDYEFFCTNKLPENLWELFNKQIYLLMNYLS